MHGQPQSKDRFAYIAWPLNVRLRPILALLGSAAYVRLLGRCILWCFLLGPPPVAAQDVLTWHNDNARTGHNLAERRLTPQNVNAQQFGKLFTIPVDGKVDAEPLYVHGLQIPGRGIRNVLYVATEHDSLYAFDADSGQQFWRVGLTKPPETPSDNRNCGQITPEIGITSTPVIDRQAGPHGVIYVIAMSKDQAGGYFQRLHALRLETGEEEFGGPVEIRAAFPGTGAASHEGMAIFDPKQYAERTALLLLNGVIYTSWTSHCDIGPYNGWVIGYDARTLLQTAVLDITPNGEEGAFWQSGAGPAADSQGNIYLLSANGTFDETLTANGFPAHGDFGNSFLKLTPRSGKLSVTDYFTMFNVAAENAVDADFGSGGPMVLPDMKDATGRTWRLAVGAGKDLSIYLVNRDGMGKFSKQGNQGVYQELPRAMKRGYSRPIPAYFNDRLYYASTEDTLREFRFEHARLIAKPESYTSLTFVYPGATPSISADGKQNGIVWVTENLNPAVLHAYSASDLSRELYNSNQAVSGTDQFGAGNKFTTPMIANGKVYVGTTDRVGVFGLR